MATMLFQDGKAIETLALLDSAANIPSDEHLQFCGPNVCVKWIGSTTLTRPYCNSSAAASVGTIAAACRATFEKSSRHASLVICCGKSSSTPWPSRSSWPCSIAFRVTPFPGICSVWCTWIAANLESSRKSWSGSIVSAGPNVCFHVGCHVAPVERQWQAAESLIDQAVSQTPNMPLARTLRAECLYRRGAAPALQIQACRDLLRVQPGNQDATRLLAHLMKTESQKTTATHSQLATPAMVVGDATGAVNYS